ncbi:MAG: hypothetical protein WCE30_12100 [Mycobacterium sp.]
MDVEEVAPDVIRIGEVSPSWLADQLDEHGVVRLGGAFSEEWLDALRKTVTDGIASNGDGDLLVVHADQEIGSPAHQLVSDPALRRLFGGAAMLRYPKAGPAQTFKCNIAVRNGFGPKMRSNRFHYDPSVLTMIVPIFIPRATVGNCGELVAFGNKRPFRRFVGTHLVETVLTHNHLYRRHLAKKVNRAAEKYLVNLQPGDAYVFWGYRQFHGNLPCEPGLLRATLVVAFGEVHAGSWALNLAWRFSRSRRHVGRLQHSPTIPARSAVPL